MYLKFQDKTVLLFALSLLCSLLTTPLEFSNDNDQLKPPDAVPALRTVVIDAGHGGKDPGGVGKVLLEKDVALSISLALGRQLRETYPDLNVIFTRETDVFIPLHERARIANKAEADLFISIHCNAIAKRNTAYGTETFILGLHRAKDNLEVAKRENAVILLEDDYTDNYDGYDPNSPEGHIILSMYQNAFLEQSILFAHNIEEQFKNNVKRHSRGVKQAGFLVLRNTTMPSVLVEAGFLSHDDEEAFLAKTENQEQIARGIFNAFVTYEHATRVPQPDLAEIRETITEYYVQLLATSRPVDTSTGIWKKCTALRTKREDNYYKYLAGPFSSAQQASAERSKLKSAGFEQAFVVAYRNDKRIPVKTTVASADN